MDNITKLTPLDKIMVVRNAIGLNTTQKSILYSIASRLGKQNFCYPSLSTLMIDCGLSKRSALTKNLDILVNLRILLRINPSNGFKSNRYGIDFKVLVTYGHQASDFRSLVQSPTVTTLVTVGHPKRNRKEKLKEIKEEPSAITSKAEEAKAEIRRICRIKKKETT